MVDSRRRELDDSLLDRIRAVVAPGDEIYTLASKWPNRIVLIKRAGIWVETLRSHLIAQHFRRSALSTSLSAISRRRMSSRLNERLCELGCFVGDLRVKSLNYEPP